MSDRELLELAAKAAGIPRQQWDYTYCRSLGHMVTQSMMWKPLDDDGDALRLAVKLGLTLQIDPDCIDGGEVLVYWAGELCSGRYIGNDPISATRSAIVRAAAEIGRSMP